MFTLLSKHNLHRVFSNNVYKGILNQFFDLTRHMNECNQEYYNS